jgi:uncharacterized protein (TIGR02452 family)
MCENATIWHNIQKQFANYTPSIQATKFVYQENWAPVTSFDHTRVSVQKHDTLDVAKTLQRPLVLILADAHSPGGNVGAGAGMQEESLFRRTALFRHLTSNLYPIKPHEAVYAPDVQLADSANIMSFIACPGLKMPMLNDHRLLAIDEETLRRKITVILQVAYQSGHTNLVLGALGCGVWGCPPKHVAEVFFDVIRKYDGVFDIITFAILGANCNFFQDRCAFTTHKF